MKKDSAINYMRGVAILFVVASHSLYLTVNSELVWLAVLYDRLISEGTTLFILISGFLFFYLRGRFNYKVFLRKKIENVVIPYVLLSIPAILVYCLGLKQDHDWIDMQWFSDISLAFKVVYMYLTGAHLGPFWYIPIIILIFIFSPLTIIIVDRVWAPVLFLACMIASYLLDRKSVV